MLAEQKLAELISDALEGLAQDIAVEAHASIGGLYDGDEVAAIRERTIHYLGGLAESLRQNDPDIFLAPVEQGVRGRLANGFTALSILSYADTAEAALLRLAANASGDPYERNRYIMSIRAMIGRSRSLITNTSKQWLAEQKTEAEQKAEGKQPTA